MRIEKINSNRIKVFITKDDLNEWNIDFNSVTGNTPAAQSMFWSMIERAEKEVDFFVKGSQLIVEAVASQVDGFIMHITKVADEEFSEKRSRVRGSDFRIRRKVKEGTGPHYIYQFKDFDDLISAVKQIAPRFSGKSALFKYDGYYLHIKAEDACDFVAVDNTLIEYGRRIFYHAFSHGYLNERGTLMIEDNAVESLAGNF